jgi:hypothetical protein
MVRPLSRSGFSDRENSLSYLWESSPDSLVVQPEVQSLCWPRFVPETLRIWGTSWMLRLNAGDPETYLGDPGFDARPWYWPILMDFMGLLSPNMLPSFSTTSLIRQSPLFSHSPRQLYAIEKRYRKSRGPRFASLLYYIVPIGIFNINLLL